jgi:hypothetical protein
MPSNNRDKTVCEKTEAIRKRAGGDINKCPVCTRSVDYPYTRQTIDGRYTEACIDACHFKAAQASPGYRQWFTKPKNIKFRADYLRWLKSH